MFLYLGRRDQHQQQQQQPPQQHFQGTEFEASGTRRAVTVGYDPEFDDFGTAWGGSPHPLQAMQQRPRQAGGRATPAAASGARVKAPGAYYPDNHPMHPEDSRLNVKWPRVRGGKLGSGPDQGDAPPSQAQSLPQTASLQPQPHQMMRPQQPLVQTASRSPPRPILAQSQPTAQQRRLELSKFDHRRSLLPPQPPPPPPLMLGDELDGAGNWPQHPPPLASSPSGIARRDGELADQHLHRLFEEIYAIRGEAETVQYKYRRERDAWAYENAALQAKLAELADQLRDRSDQLAAMDAAYADEVESLRSENRDLHMRIQEDRLAMEADAQAATARGGGGGGGGEQAALAERQVDELMAELYALKRELEKLQNRYRKERERWSAKRRELEQAIEDLISGRDPKAVQKRLAAAGDAAGGVGDDATGLDDHEDLAQASMAYYSSANAVKKEKAILELELDDEKRKNRVLEIEVEVLRDQVMRAQNRARGLPEDAGTMEDGALEKGSLEAPEKRLEARRTSAAPPGRNASGLTQPQEETLQAADKILKMEDRLHAKNVELTNQQQQLSQLKRDSEQTAAKLEDAQQRKEALQQKLAETKDELKAANAEKERAVEENERLKEENERKKEENRRMREELARVGELEEREKEAKRRDAEEKERLQDENRDLKDKLDRLRRDNDAELERLRQEKRRLEQKLREIRQKMQDGQKNYKHFQGEFDELAKLCE